LNAPDRSQPVPEHEAKAQPRLERADVEGIPAYWTEHAGPYSGGLLFRTGRADEPYRSSGVSHLVEHLALHTLGTQQDYAFNGFVSGLTTGFMAQGEPEQVAEFLSRVVRALDDLPLDRLVDEARVLRTEAMQRVAGPEETLLLLRYGATGHGTICLPEIMVLAPDPESVQSWAAERFTAGNAALWFSGPPPKALRLGLRSGQKIPPPDLKPIVSAEQPMFDYGDPGVVAISFVRPRKEWFGLALGIIAKRLTEQLRHERGLVYGLISAYQPLNAHVGHSALWTSCLSEHAEAVCDAIVGVLDDLAANGATEEEVKVLRKWFEHDSKDHERIVGRLIAMAADELLGAPVKSPEELMNEIAAIDGTELGRRTAAAIGTALLVIPSNSPHPGTRFCQCSPCSESILRGRAFYTSSFRLPWSKGPRLVVGTDGVSVVTPEKRVVTVPFASCTAVVLPTGIVQLYGEDGFRISVDPGFWWNGLEATRLILETLPRERVARVRTEEDS
jgi:hypothetical protein